jgi:hypothetical protein
MTKDEFKQKAIRTETETTVSYDLRPFGDEQEGAAAVFLGELVFRMSPTVNALNTSKALVLFVDRKYQNTPQIGSHVEKLKAAGLPVSIETV